MSHFWVGANYIFFERGKKNMGLNKDEVKKLYIDGLNSKEIAEKLGTTHESVRKCINRNFKELKIAHEKAKQERKDIARIAKQEVKKYMPDSTYIKKNRSIYETNKETGDIELRKDLSFEIPYDVPTILKTEKCISMKKEAERLASMIFKTLEERELPKAVLDDAVKIIDRKYILDTL